MSVRLIKHEAIPACGGYEVRADGRPSRHFYFDDLPSRRLRPEVLLHKEALEQPKAVARAERDNNGRGPYNKGP